MEIPGYEKLQQISVNGPVAVYHGLHTVLRRRTLLKVYTGNNPELLQRFENEARIVAKIQHTDFVTVYDFGRINANTFYIAMEYIDGGNLSEYLRDHQLDTAEKIDICFRIASAIANLHNRNIIHRDLKPENILLTRSGKLKIADFGLSMNSTSNGDSANGALLGTPLFMSPEQVNNKSINKSSDIFALGAIYYWLISGKNPFEAGVIGETFSKIIGYNPPPLNKTIDGIPDWFSELVVKMLSKNESKRPADGKAVCDIFIKNIPDRKIEPPEEKETTGRTRKILPFIIGMAGLIIIIWGLFTFPYWQQTENNRGNTDQTDGMVSINPSDSTQKEPATDDKNQNKTQLPLQTAQTEKFRSKDIAQPDDNIQNTADTYIYVDTYPWCRVFLDYKLLDETPFKDSIKVQPGKHILSLQNPEYASFTDTVFIKSGINNKFKFNLDSLCYQLVLSVQPWGKVFIDNKYIGTTPLKKPIMLTRNNKTLKITNDYYKDHLEKLYWPGKKTIKRNIILRPNSLSSEN